MTDWQGSGLLVWLGFGVVAAALVLALLLGGWLWLKEKVSVTRRH